MDYYLKDRTRLKGQPKRTIGDYAESEEILVPRRLDNFKDATSSGLKIIARNEHEQDYDGASDLIESPILDNSKYKTEKELKDKILKGKSRIKIESFCRLMNLDFEKFNEEISFSYWEHIPGFNRSIVADSAIPNKWHVMTKDLDKKSASLFTTYENGEIICYDQDIHAVVPQLLDLEPLIETYEKIRRLPNFDSNHCPLMEFQTDRDGKNYFLQYHRTLDFEPADFVLDRLANKDEIEAIFVRGATPKEGIKSKILISKKTHTLFEYERAALDVFTCMEESVATEILSRRIGTLISGPHKNLNILSSFAAEHNNRSLAFKPQNLIIYGEDIFEHAELSYKIMMAHKTGKTQYLDINIVADGRRAILSRS